ncbi:lignin-forming anionic peroxidase [Canna indica]|uniref:Lignin-forming anionic peroxidase n=1 Tax=Canna indica TaxID=4628 RepID=A0AAQ3K429_9LILI|nr:lignin-forming anionic peroxidase [Canna indica]
MRQRRCPATNNVGKDNLAPLDLVTPGSFDNYYFKNLPQKKGLLHSDQILYNGAPIDDLVLKYSKDSIVFYADFATAMVKMGDISPLTASAGESD